MNIFKRACQIICTLQASFPLTAVINPLMLVITLYSKNSHNKLATSMVVDILACIKIHFTSTLMCFLGFPASSLIFSARLFFVMMIPIWLIGFWSKNSSMKPCNSCKKKKYIYIYTCTKNTAYMKKVIFAFESQINAAGLGSWDRQLICNRDYKQHACCKTPQTAGIYCITFWWVSLVWEMVRHFTNFLFTLNLEYIRT